MSSGVYGELSQLLKHTTFRRCALVVRVHVFRFGGGFFALQIIGGIRTGRG